MPAFITNTVHIQRYADAVYGVQVGSVTLAQVNQDITSLGGIDKALNAYYAGSGQTNATIAANIVKNVGIVVGGTITAAAVTDATAYVLGQLNANKGNEGATIKNILNLVGNLTADPIYGAAAVKFNTDVDNAIAYTGAADVAAGTVTPVNFTFTTGVDNLPSNPAATYSGIDNAGAVAGGQTFNTGDVVAGALAVNVTFTGNSTVAADINNTVFNGTMLASAAINAALYDGVTAINNAGGGLANTLTVTNGELATVYGIRGDTSAAGISAGIRASNLSGTNDTIKFSVAGAGSSTGSAAAGTVLNTAVLTASSTGVEKMSLATSGTNIVSITPTNTALTDYVALEVTGNGTNTITASAMTQATNFDFSKSTGTNTLNMAGALATSTTIVGGTGADTLRIAPSTTAANINVTGVETLRLSTGGTTGSTFFTPAASFTTIRQDGDNSELGAQTLNNVGSPTAINMIGAGSTATSGAAQQFNTLIINSSFTGASDAATLTLSNQGTDLTAGVGYTVGGAATTLGGLESLTVNATNLGATGATTFSGITGTTLSSVTASSPGNMVFGTITSAGALGTGTLTSINLAGVTGTNASTLTVGTATVGGALVITGAVNGTTVAGVGTEQASDSIMFTGNVGADSFTGTGFLGSIVLDGKAGGDTLIGGSGADTITGGEGADTITGGLAADSIILTEVVAAIDQVNLGAASLTGLAAGAASTAVADTITGFNIATDIIGISITNGQTGLAITNGGNNAVAAGAAVVQQVGTAAATLGATTNVVVFGGAAVATSAALVTAIGTTAGTLLTDGTSFTANSDFVIVWSDGTNGHVGLINDANAGAAAALVAADLTYSELATITGLTVANAAALVAGNFTFIA